MNEGQIYESRAKLVEAILTSYSTQNTETAARELQAALDKYKNDIINNYADDLLNSAIKLDTIEVVTTSVVRMLAKFHIQKA